MEYIALRCLNSQIQTDINVFAVDCFSFFETKMQTEKAFHDLAKNSVTFFIPVKAQPHTHACAHECVLYSKTHMLCVPFS